jgi:hypothetical protein
MEQDSAHNEDKTRIAWHPASSSSSGNSPLICSVVNAGELSIAGDARLKDVSHLFSR